MRASVKLFFLSYRAYSLGLRENLVEQQIDHHAGHGHIHPDRPRPSGYSLMRVKAFAQCAARGHDDQRYDGKGAEQMREQDREVIRPEPRRIEKLGVRLAIDLFHLVVVREVAREKDGGGHQRGDHAVAMRDLVTAFDEDEPCGEQHGAKSVEAGVDGGQVGESHQIKKFSLATKSTKGAKELN